MQHHNKEHALVFTEELHLKQCKLTDKKRLFLFLKILCCDSSIVANAHIEHTCTKTLLEPKSALLALRCGR